MRVECRTLLEGEEMKVRTLLAYTHLMNFLLGIFSSIYLLCTLWNHLELWQVALYVYYLVLGLCGVELALWIATDGKHIERCVVNIQDLESRILDFERKIDRIKANVVRKS